MTTEAMLKECQKQHPGLTWGHSRSGNVVGFYSQTAGRFIPKVSKILTGGWAQCGDVIVNGEPMVLNQDWIEAVPA